MHFPNAGQRHAFASLNDQPNSVPNPCTLQGGSILLDGVEVQHLPLKQCREAVVRSGYTYLQEIPERTSYLTKPPLAYKTITINSPVEAGHRCYPLHRSFQII